jgi:hypothetical protein
MGQYSLKDVLAAVGYSRIMCFRRGWVVEEVQKEARKERVRPRKPLNFTWKGPPPRKIFDNRERTPPFYVRMRVIYYPHQYVHVTRTWRCSASACVYIAGVDKPYFLVSTRYVPYLTAMHVAPDHKIPFRSTKESSSAYVESQ